MVTFETVSGQYYNAALCWDEGSAKWFPIRLLAACCLLLYCFVCCCTIVFSFFISDAGFIVIHGDILDRTVRADSVLSESFCLLAACSQI